MNQALLFRSTLLRCWRFKAKTLFMGLGVTIAVLATVLLQTVAGNVREAFAAFVANAYPSDCIVLVAGSGFMGAGPGRNKLKLADVQTVVSTLGITDWDPVIFIGPRDVKNEGNNFLVGISSFNDPGFNFPYFIFFDYPQIREQLAERHKPFPQIFNLSFPHSKNHF